MTPFTAWQIDPTAQGQPRWAVGRWAPRFIVQAQDADEVEVLVAALNYYASETGAT